MTSERSSEHRQLCKVFIGGLSWDTTGERLRSYFENYGVVREAFVSYNRVNGRPRGFGFVVFETREVIDKVVSTKHTIDRREVVRKNCMTFFWALFRALLPNSVISSSHLLGHHVDHESDPISKSSVEELGLALRASSSPIHPDYTSQVEVKRAVPKEENPQDSTPPQQSYESDPASTSATSYPQPSATPTTQTGRSRKIFVGGLAPTVDEAALRAHFEAFGPLEDAVVMVDHDSRRTRGFGFVTFASDESLDLVFASGNTQTLQDKQIEIKSAVPRDQLSSSASASSHHHHYHPGQVQHQSYGASSSSSSRAAASSIHSHSHSHLGYGYDPRAYANMMGGMAHPAANTQGGGGGGGGGGAGVGMYGYAPSSNMGLGVGGFPSALIPHSHSHSHSGMMHGQLASVPINPNSSGGGLMVPSASYEQPGAGVRGVGGKQGRGGQGAQYPSAPNPFQQPTGYSYDYGSVQSASALASSTAAAVAAASSSSLIASPRAPPSSSSSPSSSRSAAAATSGIFSGAHIPNNHLISNPVMAYNLAKLNSLSLAVGAGGSGLVGGVGASPTHSSMKRLSIAAPSSSNSAGGEGASLNTLGDYSEAAKAAADLNAAAAGLAAAAAKFGDPASFATNPGNWSS